jgi:hypothetical protein
MVNQRESMKCRKTECCDPKTLSIIGKVWGFQPVDLRYKYFICINCKKQHETKKYVIK